MYRKGKNWERKGLVLMARPKLYYKCTEQLIRDGSGGRRSYRLNVLDISEGTNRARLLCAVNDVCGSERQARQLEALLTRNQVSPVHIIDVLENWLP